MLILVLAAIALLVGVPFPAAAVFVVATVWPVGFLVAAGLLAGYSAIRRHSRPHRPYQAEARFFRDWAAEAVSGASLRHGLHVAALTHPTLPVAEAARLARVGRPNEEVAEALRGGLPINGAAAGALVRISAVSGAGVGPALTELAMRALDMQELERMRRVETAQVRLSAWIIGGLPMLVMTALFLTGRGPSLAGAGLALAIIGALLVSAGAVTSALLFRRYGL